MGQNSAQTSLIDSKCQIRGLFQNEKKDTEILSVPHKKIITLQCIGQNFLSEIYCNIIKTIELYQKLDVRYPI